MSYFVYIVECSDHTFYTGIAKDVQRRIEEHNYSNKGAKYTRVRRPVKLLHVEEFENRSQASKREFEIKQMSKTAKIALLLS